MVVVLCEQRRGRAHHRPHILLEAVAIRVRSVGGAHRPLEAEGEHQLVACFGVGWGITRGREATCDTVRAGQGWVPGRAWVSGQWSVPKIGVISR